MVEDQTQTRGITWNTTTMRLDENIDATTPHIVLNDAASLRVGDKFMPRSEAEGFVTVIEHAFIEPPIPAAPSVVQLHYKYPTGGGTITTLDPDRPCRIIRRIDVGSVVRSSTNLNELRVATVVAIRDDGDVLIQPDDDEDAAFDIAASEVYVPTEGTRPS